MYMPVSCDSGFFAKMYNSPRLSCQASMLIATLACCRDQIGPVNCIATDVRHSAGSTSQGPFAYCDVTDKDNIARLVVEHRITHIMHLATLLSAVGERNPQLALRVNNLGIQNVLEVAAAHNVSVRLLTIL
jgi:threonine 3-dehydrogenase